MQLLWALADHNPRALAAFEGCNLELGHQGGREGSPWESVLVSDLRAILSLILAAL